MKKKSILIVVALILLVLVAVAVFFFGTRCEVYMCNNAKYEKSDYCESHSCRYTSWVLDEYDIKLDLCKNIAGAGGYCEEHICPVDECYNALVYNRLTEKCGKLCNEHGCEFCGNKIIKTGATCCKEHKCAISGCTETIVMLGEAKYCSEHSCSEAGCYNVQVNGTEYCKEHKNASKVNTCKAENCNNEVENGYCEEHVCSEYRCIYPAVEGSDYCKEHKAVNLDYPDVYEPDYNDDSDVETATCGSCGKEFKAGDTGKNFMSIAKTGMCKECADSYKDMSEWVEEN